MKTKNKIILFIVMLIGTIALSTVISGMNTKAEASAELFPNYYNEYLVNCYPTPGDCLPETVVIGQKGNN